MNNLCMRNNLTLIKGRLKKYIIIYKPYKLGFKFRRHGKYKSVPGSVCFKMGDREMAYVPSLNVIHVSVAVVHAAYDWGLQLL